ncbi:MAG: protein-export chaperone SecB [Acidiferrobacterales bacterium]|nr:protein-export chaperone SecB [Acidiferrobacterales bacterium]
MAENNTSTLNPKKIYLKDASFESPGSPNVFLQGQAQPDIDMNIDVTYNMINEEQTFFDVILQVTTTASQNGSTMFVAEIKQAGVFEVQAEDENHREIILHIACPNMLLPFAREELASLVSKGGFPQLLIQPINFESIYRQRLAQQAESQQSQNH